VKQLLLVVEVLSRSTRRNDRYTKRLLYQKNGVESYWIVDPYREQVEVWHPHDTKPEVVVGVLTWQPALPLKPLTIDVAPLLRWN
jgi:Uma2 family endonuclease